MPEIVDLEVMSENIVRKVGKEKLKKINFRVEKVLRNADPRDVSDSLEGRSLLGISRISKVLIFSFENKAKLAIHLMLHGNFCWKDEAKNEKGVVCEMDFGPIAALFIKDWSSWMKIELEDPSKNIFSDLLKQKYGIDPLAEDFTLENFSKLLSAVPRKGIKVVLMDQSLVSGIGNAYADEILFDAKIHPKSHVKGILEKNKAEQLWKSINKVLKESVEIVRDMSGGVSVTEQDRDFMKVYRKSGQKCPGCGYMIVQMKVNARDTFVCEKCQTLL